MDFKNITIIGLGLIGGSIAQAIKKESSKCSITAVDQEAVVESALKNSMIDVGFPISLLREGIMGADLILIATPISAILSMLPEIAEYAKPGVLVSDVGSTKSKICATAQRIFPDKKYFLGGHPMTGSERKGLSAADPFLFQNAIYVLTEVRKIPKPSLTSFTNLLSSIGAQVVFLEPQTHDRIAAAVSHLPQLLSVALVNFVGNKNDKNSFYLKMAAGGFRDMTRIASSPFDVWRDICGTNSQEIEQAIDTFIDELSQLKLLLTKEDLEAQFTNAAKYRLAIPKDSKGFLSPQYDVLLVVEDKPAVIANMSTTLANNMINIKDIEVLKVREGEGGTLRISLESEKDRTLAVSLLKHNGYDCRIKD